MTTSDYERDSISCGSESSGPTHLLLRRDGGSANPYTVTEEGQALSVQFEMFLPVGYAAGDPGRAGRSAPGQVLIMTTSAGKGRSFEGLLEFSAMGNSKCFRESGERKAYESNGIGLIASGPSPCGFGSAHADRDDRLDVLLSGRGHGTRCEQAFRGCFLR